MGQAGLLTVRCSSDFSVIWTNLKQIATILLLGILIFNWFGYRLVVSYLQNRSARELETRLDENKYDESQLISIKIPAEHLAYYNPSQEFVRVDGSVEISGLQYKYVKQRIFNDSIELMCLPDRATTKLMACNNDLFRLANGFQAAPAGHQGPHPLPNKSPVADPYVFTAGFALHEHSFTVLPAAYDHPVVIPSISLFTDERPPTVQS